MDRDWPPHMVARALMEDADRDAWVQEQTKTAELVEYLDSKLITADLHTHFMGMGDHSFWIDQIMRKYLFSNKNRPLESLEWYGPLCFRDFPTLEIILKTHDIEGSCSAQYGSEEPTIMELRDNVYHTIIHPTSDPFTITVRHNQMERVFTILNWGLSTRIVCDWSGNQLLDVGSRKESAKNRWLDIGLDDQNWKVYTMLNWEELQPVRFSKDLVANILRSFRDKEWLNLPLSPSLCKKLACMSMDGQGDWQTALNFTTDVVFDIDALRESMNIKTNLGLDNVVHEIIARLALNRKGNSGRYLKDYMFFNVKAQQFDYQLGITNTDLCYLMEARSGTELEAKATQAQIRNCFTMLNVDGSTPSNSDLVHRFRRRFTPEFYPMRFKLRDPIYEQHPYTLTLLLKHVLQSYAQSRTSYVEFSLSLKDLTTPWIYQYLVHTSIWNKIPGPDKTTVTRKPGPNAPGTFDKMEYRFLLGISRTFVKLPIDGELRKASTTEALDLLIKEPNTAMSHSLNPEAYTEFTPLLHKLNLLFHILERDRTSGRKRARSGSHSRGREAKRRRIDNSRRVGMKESYANNNNDDIIMDVENISESESSCKTVEPIPHEALLKQKQEEEAGRGFLNTVVGLDLVSEELGFPYCPFIQDEWLDLASDFKLGIRLHCGEGVVREDKGRIAKAMYAHMFIMALAIRRICARGIKCRIGHGVAFQDCIIKELTEKKKNYERVPSSFDVHIPDGTRSLTPFLALISDLLVEVNITSNYYLVQHASSNSWINANESLIKLLDNWLLCTDDDGVWAPQPCAHEHKLQAREYCSAISMGCIELKDLEKADQKQWENFRFNHSVFQQKETLKLEHTWTCKVQHPRAYAVMALALCSRPKFWKYDTLNALGVIELLHSFGYYDGFEQFAATIANTLPQIMNPRQQFASSDVKIQYFVKLLNPDGTYYGLLRSLFLGCDECLHLIWYERAIQTLCDQRADIPVPPLMPGDPVNNNNEARRNQAANTIDAANGVLDQIVPCITIIQQCQEVKNNQNIVDWMQSRVSLVYQRGRSEMEYGQKVQLSHCEAPQRAIEDHNYENVFQQWTTRTNSDWETLVKHSQTIKELKGLVLCDAKYFKPDYEPIDEPSSFFNIIWNTQDWYIRPLPPSYSGDYAHVVSADLEGFHTIIRADDRVPVVWYNAALSIAKRLYTHNPQIIRIAGVGYSGSAIAVLAGMMIATEMRHQEVVEKRSVSNEVIVWTYGGKQFGSKSFHNKVHNLCPYNLEITRWISLHDTVARDKQNKDNLYTAPYCVDKDLVVYPLGPPGIMSWELRPSWHYFTLMLHHLPPSREFRHQITKLNEMSIFFADDKRDLQSLAQSLYFPEYTLVCTHEGDNNDYGPLTTKETVTTPRIAPYVWKWYPQQRKTWKNLFDLAPVQTTMRLLGDYLRAIMALPENTIISPSETQCDIVSFITMSPSDLKRLNNAIAKFATCLPNTGTKKLPFFMDLMNRRDSFEEEYCLLLLDFISLSERDSQVSTIYQKLEKSYSTEKSSLIKSFRHPENDLITNLEMVLFVLRNCNISNPFLHGILDQLDNMIDELSAPIDDNQVKSKIIQLLLRGSPKMRDKWRSNVVNANYYSAKYKKLFAAAKVGSYKYFDLALSLHFLDDQDNSQIIEAALQRLWKVIDWMTRRMDQRYFVDVSKLWEYKLDRVDQAISFLSKLSTQEPTECNHLDEVRFENAEFTYIYKVIYTKFQLFSSDPNQSSPTKVWASLKETIDHWCALNNRTHHVLLADTIFEYIQNLGQSLPKKEKKQLRTVCQDLSKTLKPMKDDSMAMWVRAALLYQLGVMEDVTEGKTKYFKEAVDIFSTLWETGMHPKDRFSVALNTACCLARIGDDVNLAKAISWIGNFFDVLQIADDMDRQVALDWLRKELESEAGDLNNELLKRLIKPWFDATKSRFDKSSQAEAQEEYE